MANSMVRSPRFVTSRSVYPSLLDEQRGVDDAEAVGSVRRHWYQYHAQTRLKNPRSYTPGP